MIATILVTVAEAVLALLVFVGILVVVNILQNGGKWRGQTVEQILGMPADKATINDLKALSKAQLMQLFYAASVPDKHILDGEIAGTALAVGVFFPFAAFFLTYIYGQGARWVGKGFRPDSAATPPEYNLFKHKKSPSVQRKRRMSTYLAKSALDDKASLHLDYSPYNTGLVKLVRDEVRAIHSTLYIGMGCFTLPGGSLNPIPFVLHGEFRPWVGADADPAGC